MAEYFDFTCLAEGVELTEEDDLLSRYICEEVQAYYYALPDALKEVRELLEKVRVENNSEKELPVGSSFKFPLMNTNFSEASKDKLL